MIEIDKLLEIQRTWQAMPCEDNIAIKNAASEALTRCADAISVLSKNLNDIGYVWTVSTQMPAKVIEKNIHTLEKTMGSSIPPILELFWEKIGGIELVDLERYQHVEFWKKQKTTGPYFFCDGLYVDSCCDGWTSSICNDFIDWNEDSPPSKTEEFLISLSPDGFHKDNISGGSPYGVFPGNSWKPTWQYFEWSGVERPLSAPEGPTDFLSYLRTTILECAGFPAFFGEPVFTPIKERLLRGVPIF